MNRYFIAIIMLMCSLIPAMSQSKQASRTPSDKERATWNREMLQAKTEYIVRDLSLTDAQKAKFQTMYENMDKELCDLGNQTRKLQKSLTDKGEKATDLELEKGAETLFELKGRENAIEMKYFKEFKTVLTPKQLFKLKASERKFNRQLMKEHRKATKKKK